MGIWQTIREALLGDGAPNNPRSDEERLVEHGRKLLVPSGYNVRELGGYATPQGQTRYHRFLRCGGTRSLTGGDLAFFKRWGVRRVVDLRGMGEAPAQTCAFSRQSWTVWENISLFDVDISAPDMRPAQESDNYLVSSYLHMLGRTSAIKRVFEFFAEAEDDECVLFHCAAGMDRTGMVGMLLLGLVEAPRETVVADYAYSFGAVDEVDGAVKHWLDTGSPKEMRRELHQRIEAVTVVYDTVVAHHGSIRAYLESCGLAPETLEAVRAHLLD